MMKPFLKRLFVLWLIVAVGSFALGGGCVIGVTMIYPVTETGRVEKVLDPSHPDGRRWPMWLQWEAQERGVSLKPETSDSRGNRSQLEAEWVEHRGRLWAGVYLYVGVPIGIPLIVPVGTETDTITVTRDAGQYTSQTSVRSGNLGLLASIWAVAAEVSSSATIRSHAGSFEAHSRRLATARPPAAASAAGTATRPVKGGVGLHESDTHPRSMSIAQ